MSETPNIPSYHEVRIKQTCPQSTFTWVAMTGVVRDTKDFGKAWEKKLFSLLDSQRIHKERELFSLDLTPQQFFDAAVQGAKELSKTYNFALLDFYDDSGRKVCSCSFHDSRSLGEFN